MAMPLLVITEPLPLPVKQHTVLRDIGTLGLWALLWYLLNLIGSLNLGGV